MKRIAIMQDLSCLGKCSLTVVLPVISAMGVECAVLPTAVLSTHTAFPSPVVLDLTDQVRPILDHWSTLEPDFSGILTGYLANRAQAALAEELVCRFRQPGTLLVVDPAMGDHGHLYAGLSPEMVGAMASLSAGADLILPNLTEAALMTGMEFRPAGDAGYCREMAQQLLKLGCGGVMLTGFAPEPGKVGFFWTDGQDEFCHAGEKLDKTCHGTGDLFAAVTMGGLMRGRDAREAGVLAGEFVRRCIAATPAATPYGVAFEGELGWLAGQIR